MTLEQTQHPCAKSTKCWVVTTPLRTRIRSLDWGKLTSKWEKHRQNNRGEVKRKNTTMNPSHMPKLLCSHYKTPRNEEPSGQENKSVSGVHRRCSGTASVYGSWLRTSKKSVIGTQS
ncbi:hypothetical protein I7I50_01180 [Histoplasma capsulatum G186AR]|uniref:Uncharacterized protein n=1 Tax=Ajellomyces capsulatus TaxID=5037 RepID=A0A8H8D2V7_AJECA|nr:hypothetical protein I7I52_08993 [Histoplasma capsulatum]QSS73130.1 hypothetical protein I7I50_01180 [Histoplasma capsulatum G186AR]